jgi:hypothetical protein
MPGGTVTKYEDLVQISNYKLGMSDAYVTGAGLEKAMVQSLFGEADTAQSIELFNTATNLNVVNSPQTHSYTTISPNDAQVIQHSKYRNVAVHGEYKTNVDAGNPTPFINAIKVNNIYDASKNSIVMNDSTAYEHASVKFTVTDPYASNAPFSTTDNVSDPERFVALFDTSTTTGARNWVITRNVNATHSNSSVTGLMTVAEDKDWNTQNGNFGPSFINGEVSAAADGKLSISTTYGTADAKNILSTVHNGTDIKGFTATYVAGNEPVTGRYALSYANSGEASDRVEVITNNMTNLVVVTDNAAYNTFTAAPTVSDPISGAQLPATLAATTQALGPYLPPVNNGIASGFVFDIKGPVGASPVNQGAIIVNPLGDVAEPETYFPAPVTIDITNMNFTLARKYFLEKSVDTDEHTLKTSATVGSTTVENSLVITNGSLTVDNNFSILDGIEDFTNNLGTTNGEISVFASADQTNYSSVAPADRAAATLEPTVRTAGSFQYLVTNYRETGTGESNYSSDVTILDQADKTENNLSYNVKTLVTQTTTTAGYVSSNRIGNKDGAVAFVKTANSAINASGITFATNSNTYYDASGVHVIDLVCQKKWQEGNAYTMNSDGTNKTEISNVAIDITASNVENDTNLKDLRVKLDAKSLSELSFPAPVDSEGWAVAVNDGSAFLKTSLVKQGVLDDSAIIGILTASEPEPSLTVSFGPAVSTVAANRYTKFHNQLTVAHDGATQITYNDEFTLSDYSVSQETSVPVTAPQYLNIPPNTTLTMRSFTETFKVTTPFRFGNYSNISITTPTITQTTTYYALTDDINADKVLPRSYLAPIRTIVEGEEVVLQATITADITDLTVAFTQADLKPFKSQLQQQVGGSNDWVNVTSGAADVDLWYNTNTYLGSNVGDFEYAFSFSPAVNTMAEQTFFIDMSLEKGVAAFSITGKTFTPAQVDAFGEFDIATFNLVSAVGTSIGQMVATYTPDDSSLGVSGTTTLSGGGYTFTFTNNMYVDIRIVARPEGIFKVVRTANSVAGAPTYASLISTTVNSSPRTILKLANGIYTYGGLHGAIHGYSCTWTLLNDLIRIKYYATHPVVAYQRIASLNQQFRPSTGWKGVTNNIVRGFIIESTTIHRTPTYLRFKVAGYDSLSMVLSDFMSNPMNGGLTVNSINGTTNSMYESSYGTKTFSLRIEYPSYTITETPYAGAPEVPPTNVPAYKTVISDRYGVKIISKSLNTGINAQYRINFVSTRTLNVYRNADYKNNSTTLSDFTGVAEVHSFTLAALKNEAEDRVPNLIGGVIDLRFTSQDNIKDLTCFLTIAPPVLKFTANAAITNGPFFPFRYSAGNYYSYYREVNTLSANTVYPFSSAPSINNVAINFAPKSYVAYKSATTENKKVFNILPNKVKIEYATGLTPTAGDYTTVFDDYIPTNAYTSVDNKIKFESTLITHETIYDNCDDSVIISLSQGVISQATTPVIFPSGTNFNLQFKLGSHFLPHNTTYTAKFNAGDCTNLKSYCIDSMTLNESILTVTVAKYYYTSDGISADFFKDNITNGLIISGNKKQTATFSANFTATTSRINVSELLTIARGTVPNTIAWTGAADTTDVLLWVKPTQKITSVKNALRAPFLLSLSIPSTVVLFQCQDALRVHDSNEVPVHRINSNGIQINNSVSGYLNSNLVTLANAHKL